MESDLDALLGMLGRAGIPHMLTVLDEVNVVDLIPKGVVSVAFIFIKPGGALRFVRSSDGQVVP